MNIVSLYGQKQIVEQLRKLSPESQSLFSTNSQRSSRHHERQRALLHQPQHNMRDVTPLHSFATSGNEMNRVRGVRGYRRRRNCVFDSGRRPRDAPGVPWSQRDVSHLPGKKQVSLSDLCGKDISGQPDGQSSLMPGDYDFSLKPR